MANRLTMNEDLVRMGSLTSPNGQSTLVMQGDGNLVLYRAGGKVCWATATDGRKVTQAVMQGDGNFVLYGPGQAHIWDSATAGHPRAYLVVQDDGNVVIYDSADRPVWATNTNM
jgi:ABC-type nitrate/sulfonate/bicarbonate transport system substrate-binding protein